ncbi:MAG: hypothetical protein JXR51_00370 [Bacteroidales bacterium]|nr:hypothetical protein [Bacteroidales bacterium]MBN2755594.1 hypothetical protein [Bacteroidales bacterium]
MKFCINQTTDNEMLNHKISAYFYQDKLLKLEKIISDSYIFDLEAQQFFIDKSKKEIESRIQYLK